MTVRRAVAARVARAVGVYAIAWLAPVACVPVPPASGIARVRAANDFGCPKDQVTVTNIGGTSYRAEGCGLSVVYDCTGSTVVQISRYSGGTTDFVCIPETPVRPPAPTTSGPAKDVEPSPQPDESSASTAGNGGGDGEECRQAFKHVEDLAAAWHEWFPDRDAKPPPSRMEFLSVCHSLSPQQQACLDMPYGRTNRSTCAPLFDMLAPSYRARLDALFLVPQAAKQER